MQITDMEVPGHDEEASFFFEGFYTKDSGLFGDT